MESILLKAVCISAIMGSAWTALSQNYYVVVGAFAADGNASEFKAYLPSGFADTSYTTSEQDNLLHLYVLRTSDKQSAITKTLMLKKQIESLNAMEASSPETKVKGAIAGGVEAPEEPLSTPEVLELGAASASGSSEPASTGSGIPPKPMGKYFKFRIESPDGELISARVHHVDLEHGRELASYAANTFVDLLRPGQNTRPMTFACGVFGYKEIYKRIDYSDPSSTDDEAYLDSNGTWVIPYKLERLEKGDVSIMYNVSFYKDAVIMRETSRKDLDELVSMMRANPYYEITIHSYCNGKKKREIIALGRDKHYFDAAGSVTLTASAKDLTTFRAEAVRSYLTEHGIDGRRIDIFSWGGNDMLVRSDSPNASINDRIEIEINRD